MGARDAHLSSVGGLVSFNAFTREHGLHRELRRHFGRLKTGRGVVYPMAAQMQLLLDAWVAGAQRVLDVEMLAADPLFVHLAGGTVPSIDVLYDDLRRFDPQALEDLEELMSQHGTGLLKGRRHDEIFIDIDTTVMPLFGEQEGARLVLNGSTPNVDLILNLATDAGADTGRRTSEICPRYPHRRLPILTTPHRHAAHPIHPAPRRRSPFETVSSTGC